MKTLMLSLLSISLFQYAFCQVSGKLTSTNGQPLQYLNISLLKSNDTVIIKHSLTNANGTFLIENIKPGKYILQISGVGYQRWVSPFFELTAAISSKNFGTVTVKETTSQLGEVVIKADKPLYQQEIGGTVVNVQSSLLTKGSSALQVLEQSPGVVIDPRNNSIALNGKSGVMVMMDGKLMRMSMAQVVTLLNGMSADNIDKIELLTTPPAKYDADGNAGLINIVTKKNKKTGTNGSLTATAGYGRGEKGSANVSINHNTDKAGLYASYSYSHDHTYGALIGLGVEKVAALGGNTAFDYTGIAKPVSNYHNAIVGFDAKLNPATTIGASINYTNSTDYSHNFNYGTYTLKPDSILLFSGIINGVSHGQNITNSFYIERTISKGEKINFDADYIYYKSNTPTEVQSTFVDNHGNRAATTDSAYSPVERNLANSNIQVSVAKIDYSKQVNSRFKFEAGTKGTYTRSLGTSGIENLVNGNWVSSAATSNNLTTKEMIGAAYGSVTVQIDTLTSLIAGARYEYSDDRTDNAISNTDAFNRKLGKLFPSIFLIRKLNNDAGLQLSYTERISRPSYSDLASYITYNDPLSVFTGNPALKPTITNNLKLGYNYQSYLFSLLFSRDNNPIVQGQIAAGPSKDLVYITPENVAYQNNITFQTNIPIKINNWWNMNYSFAGGWKQFKLDYTLQPVQKSYFSYSANFSQTFKLAGNFSFELSGYYNSSNYYGTSKTNGIGTLNTGIKKELNNNKGSFQLSVVDLLSTNVYNSYIGNFSQDAFYTKAHINYNPESRGFPIIKVSYSRSFGGVNTSSKSKKENAAKEEQDRI